jgi:hypothetical protein
MVSPGFKATNMISGLLKHGAKNKIQLCFEGRSLTVIYRD